jgi:HD-like signal output (HDOD) protein
MPSPGGAQFHGYIATRIGKSLDALPPLPASALRVVQVAQNSWSSAADLALVVSADPGLSATVLRMANSAAYARPMPVTSVQQALVLLGFNQARNIALGAAIAGAYPPDGAQALFRVDAFWRHSLAVGFRAAELATLERMTDAPSAFTAGVVHNMGRLAMFYADPTGVDQGVAEVLRGGESIEAVDRALLGYDHAALGGQLAERWGLPITIRTAVSCHHACDAAGLCSAVQRADRYLIQHGLLPGYLPLEGEDPAGSTDAEFGRLVAQVDTLMALIRGEPAGPAASR